jgi:hypothetical protein
MSGTFNGYHVWLGIPPSEQPPNHYRLLGIAAFETDLDVIEHAADRQMAHVRTFQSGRHAALSQQILNELAAARLCLLSPDKKTAYDTELLTTVRDPAGAAAVPVGKVVPVAKAVPVAKPLAKPATAKPATAPRGQPSVRPASDEISLDLDSFPSAAPSGGPPFQIHVRRRKYNQSSAGKNAAILGVLMAIVVITGMVLYQFLGPLLSTMDLKEIIFGTSNSTPAPGAETTVRPPSNSATPPPPAPNPARP